MRYRYGKWLGMILGALFGNILVLWEGIYDLLWGHSNSARIWLHDYGPIAGSIYCLLPLIPFAFLFGLVFGIIGFQWGHRWQEAANQRSAQRIAAIQAQQADNVWPPPPIKGDTDDT